MAEEAGFGLYVHWPYCQAKCPYCDFNSHVSRSIDHEKWAQAYEREIGRLGRETGGRRLRSIFFGGGTPSLMEGEVVDRVIAAARAAWRFDNDIEITLEANPTSVEAGRFDAYRRAGVNRISIGFQSLRSEDLRRLGRLHDVGEALEALTEARRRFGRVSFDLIYGRQDQAAGDWATELEEALALGPDHLSLYMLTIESGTAFGDRFAAGRLRGLPDEDRSVALWEVTQEMTAAAGLPGYEISNHAHPGSESRHNLIYWRGGDYAGVGPGAHGRLTVQGVRHATEAPKAPLPWLEAVLDGRDVETREVLSDREVRDERIMMGLRLREGVPEELLAGIETGPMEELGLVERRDGRVRLTEAGRPLLNAVLRELLAA